MNPESQAAGGSDKAEFKEDEFVRLRKAKNSLKPTQLTDSEEGVQLIPFMEEIFSYRFA